jgi:tripartite-type tricarboxylate transporter receptor subunit TctC
MRAFAVACALASALAAPAALAQDYPTRPVRIVVGFPAGAAGDLAARTVGTKLGQALGQQVIVENKPGASSNIATEFAARAPKDGYTLFLGTVANAVNAAVASNLPFDLQKDFTPIGLVAVVPVILVVNPSTGVGTLAELVALAKKKPGELFYASTGVATTPHLAGELLNVRAGIKLVHVPYQGSPQAVTDLLAGRTQIMFASASTVIPHIAAGTLKAIAWASSKRSSLAPDLPTVAEAGHAELDASIWFGLMAPSDTPTEIIGKLGRALDEVMNSRETLAQLKTQGFEPLTGGGQEFSRYIAAEQRKWTAAAETAGVRK